MRNTFKDFKRRALARPDVRREYDNLKEEFELLDEILKARTEAGLTQAEVAERIGTTQSAVARMETAIGKHSPSIATLKRYASALGYRVQLHFVKEPGLSPPKAPRAARGQLMSRGRPPRAALRRDRRAAARDR